MLKTLKKIYASVAPGLFIVGYVIGTGSVTSMVVAGARYGMSLTWALLLSCIFTFVMLIAIGKLTIVTGATILSNIRRHFGSAAAIFLIVGLMITVISSISGVMGIMVEITQEWLIWLGLERTNAVLITLIFTLGLLAIFWSGRHQTILNFMTLMVGLMALNFILTNFLIVQDPQAILSGMIPSIPDSGDPQLVIAGIVGTTMAAVVLVSRSSLIAESAWSVQELKKENKDALVAVVVTFVVSAAIMAAAAGTLNLKGIEVENAIEMVHAIRPLAGELAVFILLLGIISAGLSSIFPNIVLLPWLISDISHRKPNLKTTFSRVVATVVALSGFLIPVFGGKPVAIMIASQAFSPVMMPLLIIFLIILLNKKSLMGAHRPGLLMNAALFVTLLFSIYMLLIALQGYLQYFV